MLTVSDLHVDYAGVVALRGVDLTVRSGELVALVGANGAGKSTLLAAVSGLHRPVRGTVTFLDENVSGLPAYRIARRGAVLVPEGRRLFGHQTVRQNLMLGGYGQFTYSWNYWGPTGANRDTYIMVRKLKGEPQW